MPRTAPPARPPGRRLARRLLLATALLAVGVGCWLGFTRLRSWSLGPARAAEVRGDFLAAARLARDHLALFPLDREAALLAGRSLSRMGRAEEAEPFFRKAGRLSPDDGHVRAFGWLRVDDREAAIRAYEDILQARPGDVLALRRLGGIAISQGRYADAARTARRLIEAPGGAVIGYTLLGVAHHNLAESAEAAEAFETVLVLDPELREMPLSPPRMFWAYLTHDLLAIGRHDAVKRHARKALERGPDSGLLHDLALAHYGTGDVDEAEHWWLRATQLTPDYPPPWLYLGRVALGRDQPERAAGYLERAVRLAPEASEPRYSLSLALRRLGRDEEAGRHRAEADRIREINDRATLGATP